MRRVRNGSAYSISHHCLSTADRHRQYSPNLLTPPSTTAYQPPTATYPPSTSSPNSVYPSQNSLAQPGRGLRQQAPGYQPSPSYGQTNPGYPQPAQANPQQSPLYSTPPGSQAAPGYAQPAPAYAQPVNPAHAPPGGNVYTPPPFRRCYRRLAAIAAAPAPRFRPREPGTPMPRRVQVPRPRHCCSKIRIFNMDSPPFPPWP